MGVLLVVACLLAGVFFGTVSFKEVFLGVVLGYAAATSLMCIPAVGSSWALRMLVCLAIGLVCFGDDACSYSAWGTLKIVLLLVSWLPFP